MRLRASVAAFELPLATFVKSGLSENFRVIRKVKKIQGNSKRQNHCAFPGRIWMVAVGLRIIRNANICLECSAGNLVLLP